MEEMQTGRKEGDDGSSAMFGEVERRGGTGLVVVFQESREAVLVSEVCGEVLPHRAGMAVAQSVIEPFVIAIVEALLLQRPFKIPIDFGQEDESPAPSRVCRESPVARTVAIRYPKFVGKPRAARASPCRSGRRRIGRRCAPVR